MMALCQDENVIGCDFYVMKRIEGIIPRANLPKELQLDEQQVQQLCLNVLDKLIELHRAVSRYRIGTTGQGEGCCRRQVEGWDARYSKALTPNVPDFAFCA